MDRRRVGQISSPGRESTVILTTVIFMIICCRADAANVQMVEGDDLCSGTPEVYHEGKPKKLENYYIYYGTIEILCRELNCGDVVNAMFRNERRSSDKDLFMHKLDCQNSAQQLSGCKIFHVPIKPSYRNISITISCSDLVRLENSAGVCSGRVEVKSGQSWMPVCETDFDWQDAQVVCREMGCGTLLKLQGVPYGKGYLPFGTTEFHCNGTEKNLRACSILPKMGQTCIPGQAVQLTCSGPDDVRLVEGSGRCTGTVEIFSDGVWRKVTADRWSMQEASVVCRQLDCGSAVMSTMRVAGKDEIAWGFHVACKGSESAVKECTILYSWEVRFPVGVICSEFVRLVDRYSLCSGRVEVKLHQSWSPVYEGDFDWQDAEVVCRELGCGPPLTLPRMMS
ncbi:scavenger receptor cysteine-rich type 1 protein M130-like [Hoplias malabaricus]|uniref:scavenger receptor cysteine-rich type 1 protein M130-like n=1 Tax=Hoplias malabaricus TaxID=27720 RepID=UPI003462D843